MKKFFAAAAIVSAAVIMSTTAFANSCSQQGGECAAWARGQGAQASTYVAACRAEVGRCVARCKVGQKFFVGVSNGPGGGQQYAITDCK